jgi:O-antigen/teichoic acid export membrane protein
MSNEHEHLKKITKGAMVVFIGIFIGRFFGYITRIIMARFFGADAYGLFSLASAVLGIAATIALLGIPTGLSRYISFYIGKKDLERVWGTVISGLKITIPFGIVMGFFVFLFAEEISINFFKEVALTPLLQLFAIVIPLYVLLYILLASFRGFQNMKYKVIIEDLLKPSSTLLLVLLFFFLGYDIFGAVIAYSIGYLISCVVGFYLLLKLLSVSGRLKSIQMGRELLSFSWPLIIAGYFWMVISWTDTVMLGIFWTVKDVGIYNVALPTAAMIFIVVDAFGYMFMPVISELYAKGKKVEIIQTHKSLLKWIFMINLSFFLVMVLFPDNVIGVLFGEGYIDASLPLVILAIGYMISILGALSGQGIVMIGKTKLSLIIVFIGSLSNLIINLVLIPPFGMVGAAVVTSISFVLMSFLNFFFAHE